MPQCLYGPVPPRIETTRKFGVNGQGTKGPDICPVLGLMGSGLGISLISLDLVGFELVLGLLASGFLIVLRHVSNTEIVLQHQ